MEKRGCPGGGHTVFALWDTLYFDSKSGSYVFISPIPLTLQSRMPRIPTAASLPGSCGWRGSFWMTYVLAQVSPGVLGWGWGCAEDRARRLQEGLGSRPWPGVGGLERPLQSQASNRAAPPDQPHPLPAHAAPWSLCCPHGPCSSPTAQQAEAKVLFLLQELGNRAGQRPLRP